MDIAQTVYDLAEARQKLHDTKKAVPYVVSKEIAAHETVVSLEAGLKYAQKVLRERF